MDAKRLCAVCKVEPHKYRCSTCRKVRYCSLACHKVHRETCSGETITTTTATTASASASRSSGGAAGGSSSGAVVHHLPELEPDDPRYIAVTQEQLARIRGSSSLRAKLRDERLQAVITRVVGTKDPVAELIRLRATSQRFADFADDLLTTIGACEVGDDGAIEFVL